MNCRSRTHSLTSGADSMLESRWGWKLAAVAGTVQSAKESSLAAVVVDTALNLGLWDMGDWSASAIVTAAVVVGSRDANALNGLSRRTTW